MNEEMTPTNENDETNETVENSEKLSPDIIETEEPATSHTEDAVSEEPSPPDAANDTTTSSEDFSQMLDADVMQEVTELKPGSEVTGTIVQIGDHDAFVDCGARSELPISVTDLKDENDELKYQVGDTITAHVQKVNSELKLTLAINLNAADMQIIEDAAANRTPIEGTVKETNKGGFTVDLGGLRAFCPFSQIDLRRIDNPEQFIGKKLPFMILEMSGNGKNIVVSRRAILQLDRDKIAGETRANLNLGDIIEGTVSRLVPFGAFVDIGGVEGLVHISQISHQRIRDAASVLTEGQQIKVQVMEIQNLGKGRSERISLSIKALAQDPWPETTSQLQISAEIPGQITRLTDFGAFVEIKPGVEGLIHISEMAHDRIYHPQDVVSEGEEVVVRVLDIDLQRRRISLSLKQVAEQDEE